MNTKPGERPQILGPTELVQALREKHAGGWRLSYRAAMRVVQEQYDFRRAAALSSPHPEAREEDIEIAIGALEEIATTMPSRVCLNMNAKTSDPDHVKLRNNHMATAAQALSRLAAPKPEGQDALGTEKNPYKGTYNAVVFQRHDNGLRFGVCERDDGFEFVVHGVIGGSSHYALHPDALFERLDKSALSSPHPEAREGVMDALDFASQLETALAKGAWKHTELANRIEMYAESRLAAQKDEGQDAREKEYQRLVDGGPCGLMERPDIEPNGCRVVFDAEKCKGCEFYPAAPEPRPAEEPDHIPDVTQMVDTEPRPAEEPANLCEGCGLWPCGHHSPIGVRGCITTECANRKPTTGQLVADLRSRLARKDEGQTLTVEQVGWLRMVLGRSLYRVEHFPEQSNDEDIEADELAAAIILLGGEPAAPEPRPAEEPVPAPSEEAMPEAIAAADMINDAIDRARVSGDGAGLYTRILSIVDEALRSQLARKDETLEELVEEAIGTVEATFVAHGWWSSWVARARAALREPDGRKGE